jgi:hypothetical protein
MHGNPNPSSVSAETNQMSLGELIFHPLSHFFIPITAIPGDMIAFFDRPLDHFVHFFSKNS